MEVSVRKLKNRLSEYRRRAQTGEEVVITSRGIPVARLLGLVGGPAENSESASLEGLRSMRWIRPAKRGAEGSVELPESVSVPDGVSLSDAVMTDRRDAGP